ncbi:hypothetical protein LUD75_13995 [Epilithonimonas sp. JDS]|uniref:hypothetical protein n=1 Tax=Epilithonimonas sp. JDS TaxID=2902797 RepID=UPI001E607D3F|nr:hypothetical protein [Epilithonimonas sp. JDS]MCD9855832.1 hypothetical protein [Epilithonimonas sp. JDS]
MKLIPILLLINTVAFAQTSQKKKIGEEIEGHFLGNGKAIVATATKTKEAKGNPIENGTPAEYEIRFSDKKLKPIKIGCCEMTLINEGDLDNNGADDLSVFQAPMNGCTYSMTTYSFINGNWRKIVDTFLIPTGCESINHNDLQKMIFRENKNIYYLEKDLIDENGKLIKKKATK